MTHDDSDGILGFDPAAVSKVVGDKSSPDRSSVVVSIGCLKTFAMQSTDAPFHLAVEH